MIKTLRPGSQYLPIAKKGELLLAKIIIPHHQIFHQGRLSVPCAFAYVVALGAAGNWRIRLATCPRKKVISSLSCLTNSLSSGSGGACSWSSISTNKIIRLLFIFFSAFNAPVLMALRIVPGWQFRSLAASWMVTCILLPVACAFCLSRVYRQYLMQVCACLSKFVAVCISMYMTLLMQACSLRKQLHRQMFKVCNG